MSEPERIKIDGERYYKVGADKYPSVTTVTGWDPEKKRAISNWEDGLADPDLVRDEKALLGTLVHHRILDPYAMRKLPPPEIDLDLAYDGIHADIEACEVMWDEHEFDLGDSPYIEQRVYNHTHGYAGTLDALTGDGIVVDLKTSKTCYSSHKMQVSAYFHAVKERQQFDDPTGAAIAVIHPDPANNPKMEMRVHRLDTDEIGHWFGRFTDLLSKKG